MAGNVAIERLMDGVALLTVGYGGDPAHLTTCATVDHLANAIEEAIEGGARVIVLASSVEGHWLEHSSLTDLLNLVEGKEASGDGSGWFRSLQQLNRGPAVTIAAIAGDTSGGGCELGWACDLRIAEENVRFSQPEVIIGAGTGIGGTSRLMRLIGRTVAAEVVLTGQPLSAQRLYELGGINRVVPKGAALETALELAARIASNPPQAVAGMKKMLGEAEDLSQTAGIENDQAISQQLFAHPGSMQTMRDYNSRLAAGETMDQAYWS
jgi:enoyl-CoA hydratase/carnithine racemase